MICPKCGRNNPDGMACPCGAPLLSSNPAVNLLKSLGSSPLFLAAAILATAAPVLFILALVTSGGQYASGLISFRYTINGQEVVYPGVGNDFGAVVLGSLLFALPVLLAALGMWLFYGSSRNRHTGNVSTAGLTICKVIAIAAVVLCIVAAALYAILLLLLMIFSNAFSEWIYYNSGEYVPAGLFVGLALVALVFFVGLMLLPIFFYFGVIKALNRMKRTARTGEPNDKVSYYVMVFLFILAVFGAIGGLVGLFSNFWGGASSLCYAAFYVLCALLLNKYRNKMTMLRYPPVQPVYAAPAGTVQPPYQQPYQHYGQPYQAPQGPQAQPYAPPPVPSRPVVPPQQAPAQGQPAAPVQPVAPVQPAAPQEKSEGAPTENQE